MKIMETERLILRAPTLEDAQDMYEYAKSPNIGPNAGWKPHENIEESKKILQMFVDDNVNSDEKGYVYAIELKENNKFIGSIGIHRNDKIRNAIEKTAMLGYVLSEDYWGKGIMTEAANAILKYCFEEEKLWLVSVYHYDYNKRSRRVIEKLGFKFEGVLRYSTQLLDARVCDDWTYSMTHTEYMRKIAAEQKLVLKLPEEFSKDEYLSYCKEVTDEAGEEGVNPYAAVLHGKSYEEWLEHTVKARTNPDEGLVPSTVYFLLNEKGRVLGAIDLRHYLNEYLRNMGGHIGYGVRPSERKRGFASIMLALALEKLAEISPDEEMVLVTCDDNNIGSAKTIEANGGVLENKVTDERDGSIVRRYWIKQYM